MVSKDKFIEDSKTSTLAESFDNAVKQFGHRKCLGWRPITNGKAGEFKWHTYKEAHSTLLGQCLAADCGRDSARC